MAADPPHPPPRAGASTERHVVEAATMLFYERGYHGTSVRDIAEAVGIKAASIYNHVSGKQELLYRIALSSITELLEGGRRVLEEHDDPADQLAAFVRFHVTYHAEHRFRAKVSDDQLHALSRRQLTKVLEVRDEYEAIIRGILARGHDAHGWLIDDVAVQTFAIATMCTAVGVWYRDDGRLSPGEIAELYGDMVLRMVGEDLMAGLGRPRRLDRVG